MSAPSTSGLSVIKSYCYELSTLNKVYFTLLYPTPINSFYIQRKENKVQSFRQEGMLFYMVPTYLSYSPLNFKV